METSDNGMDKFLEYCSSNRLQISSAVCPKYTDASGLGLHAANKIRKGEQVIFAPFAALLTTASVPSTFLPERQLRQELTAHGLLASWLAFGDEEKLEARYGPWMNVWPAWHVFRDSLPVLWDGEALLPPSRQNNAMEEDIDQRGKSKHIDLACRKTSKGTHPGTVSRAKGSWLSDNASAMALLQEQSDKIQKILAILHQHQAQLGFDILSPTTRDKLIKFLHMWCCVNTRCFYYVLPGRKPPADPNEAMVLVPFLDLFNHSTTGEGLVIQRDKNGFAAIADRDYGKDEEMFIEYSQGSNDVLWLEYGFNLDDNAHDELNIDHVVLKDLSEELKEFLQDAGYLAEWTVSRDEIGYRLQTTAWLLSGALDRHQWTDKHKGLYDPEDDETPRKYAAMHLQVCRQLVKWLVIAKKGFEDNLEHVARMEGNPADQKQGFVHSDILFDHSDPEHERHLARAAKTRFNMCLMRWKQSRQICISAIECIEADCPGARGKA